MDRTLQVPPLVREQWETHPNFPRQALLLGSHRSFRTVSRTLVERARAGRDAIAIAWVFESWKAAMGGHEAYEEGKLYPFLEARWGLSMEVARAGHERLAELHEDVIDAVGPGDASADLVAALEAHDAALNAHLDLEEELVIPALLALEPAEFEWYYRASWREVAAVGG